MTEQDMAGAASNSAVNAVPESMATKGTGMTAAEQAEAARMRKKLAEFSSRALYEDMPLSAAQRETVREYLRAVNFHIDATPAGPGRPAHPGAGPDDFEIADTARYLGYMFQKEDLESFGVGLRCTVEGLQGVHTFIRMSRGQLLGEAEAKRLAVNTPVRAADALTMRRFRDTAAAPVPTGEDAYTAQAGVAGGNEDLAMLEAQLADIRDYHAGRPVYDHQEMLDLKIYWGTLLAGRYPRLKYFERNGELSPEQVTRLHAFEGRVEAATDMLEEMGLPTFATLRTTPVVNG